MLLRIDDGSLENRTESRTSEFKQEITRIGDALLEHSNALAVSTENDEFDRFNEKHHIFNTRLKTSVILLNAVSDDDKEKCEKLVLEVANTSSSLIKEGDDGFTVIQKRWQELNKRMSETYIGVYPMLGGLKKRKVLTNSLYIFLQADNVDALDTFWKEYLDGTLKSKILTTMFRRSKNRGANICITATEVNYRRYRTYLGELYLHINKYDHNQGQTKLIFM